MTAGAQPAPLARAWYGAPIAGFLAASDSAVLGQLAAASEFGGTLEQRDAWSETLVLLREALAGREGYVFLEFAIPRMGRRADAIVLLGSLVVVIELKVGAEKFIRADINQVWDYALDLKRFHAASHDLQILPILVATAAKADGPTALEPAPDQVFRPVGVKGAGLWVALERGARLGGHRPTVDAEAWSAAPYEPSPSIIKAAQDLYAGHTVEAIARSGAQNLGQTVSRARALMEDCRVRGRKAICFVTGVPGAGKTLVGLDLAAPCSAGTRGVYLSGNGPLVAVLTEALARDDYERRRRSEPELLIQDARAAARSFIQNVHHYRDEYFRDPRPPDEHVAIFDEAQRAWNRKKLADFMTRRKKRSGVNVSESELLIEYLDRHPDWALVTALVGGGQEINTGEAGIGAWLEALAERFTDWDIYLSPHLREDAALAPWLKRLAGPRLHEDEALHLAVSMRTFRAAGLNEFVNALLACDQGRAREALSGLRGQYPIVLGRDLEQARAWIRGHARGSERFGLLASSKGLRLKPLAVDVRYKVDPVQWFLKSEADTRSSYYLEDAATEFDVQGLELDWTCVAWDGDLRMGSGSWKHHRFKGSDWERIRQPERQTYQRNAYRVLLTRARQGMVMVVPRGSASDSTRDPAYYDGTYEYLASLGLETLQ